MNNESPVADSTLDEDSLHLDPSYSTADDKPPPVWAASDQIRDLLKKTNPDKSERAILEHALVRQLRTALLHEAVLKSAAPLGEERPLLILYVILFPGEARDNTGLKDLNDKVLGFKRHTEYIRERQEHIRTIFPQYGFAVVGQDYKTAVILGFALNRKGAVNDNRKLFDDGLKRLDAALREALLKYLRDAEGDPQYKDESKKLRQILEKNPDYRFDLFYGLSAALPPVARVAYA